MSRGPASPRHLRRGQAAYCAGLQRDPHVEDEDEDPFMSDDYSSTPVTPGALEAVDKLVAQRFQDRVYLLCVAAPQVPPRV